MQRPPVTVYEAAPYREYRRQMKIVQGSDDVYASKLPSLDWWRVACFLITFCVKIRWTQVTNQEKPRHRHSRLRSCHLATYGAYGIRVGCRVAPPNTGIASLQSHLWLMKARQCSSSAHRLKPPLYAISGGLSRPLPEPVGPLVCWQNI